MLELKTNDFNETIELGYKIGSLLAPGDVLLLAGDLGAGKTTFTKGIGKALGIKRTINSPTFTIVKEYNGTLDLYHLDLYRLEGLGTDFDLEEYFSKDGVVVCEWPNNVSEILPSEYLLIEIFRDTLDKRIVRLTPKGERYQKLVGELDV
jgi:tRNA threonylcarbamoyladenosine biosynthesis protein TsaE